MAPPPLRMNRMSTPTRLAMPLAVDDAITTSSFAVVAAHTLVAAPPHHGRCHRRHRTLSPAATCTRQIAAPWPTPSSPPEEAQVVVESDGWVGEKRIG